MEKQLEKSLEGAIDWLIKTKTKNGGSSAQFSLIKGWSKPYPETTGYIIPTLIKYQEKFGHIDSLRTAVEFGEWLLDIQNENGYWNGGLHPQVKENPSIFNTGQILFGMASLYEKTGEKKWLNSALEGANWLAGGVNKDGLWSTGHYNDFNPTYYTRVAWPMLVVAKLGDNAEIQKRAISVLDNLLKRQNANGTFLNWEFKSGDPAFTHTIAYTVRGFIESSLILEDWDRYGRKLELTLEKLYRLSELNNGRLAGAYNNNWKPVNYYTCLTGNVQTAICLMKWYQVNNDLRLVNSAGKLIEQVERAQIKSIFMPAIQGAIAGSLPVWGRYMFLRYPNWATKFYADSIMLFLELTNHIKKEWQREG